MVNGSDQFYTTQIILVQQLLLRVTTLNEAIISDVDAVVQCFLTQILK